MGNLHQEKRTLVGLYSNKDSIGFSQNLKNFAILEISWKYKQDIRTHIYCRINFHNNMMVIKNAF